MTHRVFVHVGAPKTGTSYLQSTMDANRTVLAGHGLSYPQTGSGTHFEAAIDLIDHRWGGLLKQARGEWDALAKAALRAPGDAIISHELLAAATRDQVDRARQTLAGAELHVVLTARDLGRQIPAEWQETIKHRGRMRLHRFTRKIQDASRTASDEWFWRVQGLPDVLTRWSTGLPPDRVHLVTVPPPGAPRDLLWQRFAGVLGLDPGVFIERGERDNTSLGITEINVLRLLNVALKGRSIPVPVYADVVRDLIVRESLAGREGQARPTLAPAARGFVDAVSEEWAEWIEGSGVHLVGDLDDLRPRWADPDEWVNPDALRPTEALPAAIDALAVMVEQERDHFRETRERPLGAIRGPAGPVTSPQREVLRRLEARRGAAGDEHVRPAARPGLRELVLGTPVGGRGPVDSTDATSQRELLRVCLAVLARLCELDPPRGALPRPDRRRPTRLTRLTRLGHRGGRPVTVVGTSPQADAVRHAHEGRLEKGPPRVVVVAAPLDAMAVGLWRHRVEAGSGVRWHRLWAGLVARDRLPTALDPLVLARRWSERVPSAEVSVLLAGPGPPLPAPDRLDAVDTDLLRRLNQLLATRPEPVRRRPYDGPLAAVLTRAWTGDPGVPEDFLDWAVGRGERLAADLACSSLPLSGDPGLVVPSSGSRPRGVPVRATLDRALDVLASQVEMVDPAGAEPLEGGAPWRAG